MNNSIGMENQKAYRVLDANINRAKEGLRVLEEIVRFVLDHDDFSSRIKCVRHDVSHVIKMYFDLSALKLARDTETDVGRNTYTQTEAKRDDMKGLFMANMSRVQEALRVLEEFSKLISKEAGEAFKKIRYDVYILEKDILAHL